MERSGGGFGYTDFKEAGVTDPIEYEHLSSPAADALKAFVKVRE